MRNRSRIVVVVVEVMADNKNKDKNYVLSSITNACMGLCKTRAFIKEKFGEGYGFAVLQYSETIQDFFSLKIS